MMGSTLIVYFLFYSFKFMQTPNKNSIPKIHPVFFMLILGLVFLAPSAVTAFSGGSIPKVQIPSHTFPMFKR